MQRKFSIAIESSTAPQTMNYSRMGITTYLVDGVAGRGQETALIRVRQADFDFATIHGGQGIEQVVHIKADLDLIACVNDFHFLFCFLLLRIVSLQYERIRLHRESNPTILFIGQDRRALQGGPEYIPIGLDLLRAAWPG